MEEYESCEKCLHYLNKIEHQVRFRDAVVPTDAAADGWKSAELLKHYNRAIELLPEEWSDENYIIISIRHALLLLSVDEMNATFCINLIHINCNKKAQVALSMAEYYLKKNDRESSLTCLERAHHRGAQPTSLIEEALAALKRNSPTLSHLIDSRFYYEPPDEVPLSFKVEPSGESRASTSKHRLEKPRIKSGDHSVAKKLLVKDLSFLPSEQPPCVFKPMRVPRKQKDDEPPELSEEPDLQPSTSSAARLAEDARQPCESGAVAAARPLTAVDRVPSWPPKAPLQNRKAGPQLKFQRNFQPMRMPKKPQGCPNRLGTSTTVAETFEDRSKETDPGSAELAQKAPDPEANQLKTEGRVAEAHLDNCSSVRTEEKIPEVQSSRRGDEEEARISELPVSYPFPSSLDNLLSLKAAKPSPSSHTGPSCTSSAVDPAFTAATATTSRHSASPGDGSASSARFLPPPPPLPRPAGSQNDGPRRAGLGGDPAAGRGSGMGAAANDKENLRPSVSSKTDPPQTVESKSAAKNDQVSPSSVVDPSSNFGEVFPLRKKVSVNGQLYNISKVIGRGGSCVVYEAKKSQNGDDVFAIKLVSFIAVDETVIASYKNEVERLLRLQKTGKVIRLFDHEIQEDGMALVMERAEADFKSVHALLLAKGGAGGDQKVLLPACECLRLWKEMLECVEALHENGVVHLDLKPGNFVLVKGVPKLIDLGISHSIPEDRTSVTLQHHMGSIDYMSPEQLPDSLKDDEDDGENVKKRIGRKSDVWALGCILYLLMFGRPPFRNMHYLRRLQSINSNKPVTIPDYPAAPQLVLALQMCLQRDPNARASVADILAFLKENPA